MALSHTSRHAYNRIKDKLSIKQEVVYDAIRELGAAHNEEIADYLGWPINSVTGRVSELKNMELLNIEGIGRTKRGFTAKKWSVADPNDVNLSRIAKREEVDEQPKRLSSLLRIPRIRRRA